MDTDFLFFFQAEDGIRDVAVTGVQTCALPISAGWSSALACAPAREPPAAARWPRSLARRRADTDNNRRSAARRPAWAAPPFCNRPHTAARPPPASVALVGWPAHT